MGPLVGVDLLVELEVDVLCEALVAELTHKRLLPLVEADVGLEVGGGAEALVAALVVALEGLLAAVDQQMLLEVSELAEGLGALLALVWLHPAVDPHVHLEVGHLLEGLVALQTGQRQVSLPEHRLHLPPRGGPQLRPCILIDSCHRLAIAEPVLDLTFNICHNGIMFRGITRMFLIVCHCWCRTDGVLLDNVADVEDSELLPGDEGPQGEEEGLAALLVRHHVLVVPAGCGLHEPHPVDRPPMHLRVLRRVVGAESDAEGDRLPGPDPDIAKAEVSLSYRGAVKVKVDRERLPGVITVIWLAWVVNNAEDGVLGPVDTPPPVDFL